jgi:hypothetical protein
MVGTADKKGCCPLGKCGRKMTFTMLILDFDFKKLPLLNRSALANKNSITFCFLKRKLINLFNKIESYIFLIFTYCSIFP